MTKTRWCRMPHTTMTRRRHCATDESAMVMQGWGCRTMYKNYLRCHICLLALSHLIPPCADLRRALPVVLSFVVHKTRQRTPWHRGTTVPRSNLDGAVSRGIAERAKERSERDPAAAAAFLMAGMADDQEDRGSAMIDVTRLTRTRVTCIRLKKKMAPTGVSHARLILMSV